MTTNKPAGEMPEFDYNLVFDPTESGAAQYSYFGLVTDYGSPADILIRVETRRAKEPWEKAEHLAREVVKRWNAYEDTRADKPDAAAARNALDDMPAAPDIRDDKSCDRFFIWTLMYHDTIKRILQREASGE